MFAASGTETAEQLAQPQSTPGLCRRRSWDLGTRPVPPVAPTALWWTPWSPVCPGLVDGDVEEAQALQPAGLRALLSRGRLLCFLNTHASFLSLRHRGGTPRQSGVENPAQRCRLVGAGQALAWAALLLPSSPLSASRVGSTSSGGLPMCTVPQLLHHL